VDSERRSPYTAMFASGGLFLLGSLPSVLPFMFLQSTNIALVWASLLALGGLFVVGVVKARVTGGSWARSGSENMVIAGFGGVAAWFIGDVVGRGLA
ncbi:MAG: VIT1/CCC1 transporter family protein, partial [Acidimicrobiia bacterium]|nr:VIT1/CCC1 transporter family protein [Acidimicrobiia bacterium]